jgi:hypothetical protein
MLSYLAWADSYTIGAGVELGGSFPYQLVANQLAKIWDSPFLCPRNYSQRPAGQPDELRFGQLRKTSLFLRVMDLVSVLIWGWGKRSITAEGV